MHFCTSFFILKVGIDDVCCFQNRAPFTFYGIIGQLRLMFGFFGGWVVSCLPFLFLHFFFFCLPFCTLLEIFFNIPILIYL